MKPTPSVEKCGTVSLLTGKIVNAFPSDYVESSEALILQILSFQLQINSLKSKNCIQV